MVDLNVKDWVHLVLQVGTLAYAGLKASTKVELGLANLAKEHSDFKADMVSAISGLRAEMKQTSDMLAEIFRNVSVTAGVSDVRMKNIDERLCEITKLNDRLNVQERVLAEMRNKLEHEGYGGQSD